MKIKLVTPWFYEEFRCIADECRHNCCEGGWLIELGQDTVAAYEKIGGEAGKRLLDSLMQDEEGSWCFRLQDGRCPHLDKMGLCRVYQELGEDYMGVVCKEFPRFSLYYGNIKETGIGLGCEEAAGIILGSCQPFCLEEVFLEEEIDVDTEDKAFIDVLLFAREKMMAFLSDFSKPFAERIRYVLFFAEELQRVINEGEPLRMHQFLEKDFMPAFCGDMEADRAETAAFLLDIYGSLELLEDCWPDWMERIEDVLKEGNLHEVYESMENGQWIQYNLLTYFLFRYFMKAFYDYNVSDKVRFALCNYVMITGMLKASCGQLIDVVRIFSRQVEYSEINVEQLLEEFNFGDELSAERLMTFIETKGAENE